MCINRIILNVFVYKVPQYHEYDSVSQYFVDWLISSFMIKSCMIKESFLVCSQENSKPNIDYKGLRSSLRKQCTPNYNVKKQFGIDKLV